jgi:D-alanyl-D-alanine carboxypeptidase
MRILEKVICLSLFIFTIFNFNFLLSVRAQQSLPEVVCYSLPNRDFVDIDGKRIDTSKFNCSNTESIPLPGGNVKKNEYFSCIVLKNGKQVDILNNQKEIPTTQCRITLNENQISVEQAKAQAVRQYNDESYVPSSAKKACGGKENYNCYTLIEPIGTGTNIIKSFDIRAGGLGIYINMIFMYLLMLIVVISVFYLIYGGTLYLTTDIINKKFEGKETIQRVVVGLIFVFSVWTIMNTINPNLLANTLNFNNIKDLITSEPVESEEADSAQTPANENPVTTVGFGICPPSDVVKVIDTTDITYIEVCKDVEKKMQDLIAAAKADKIKLTRVSDRGDWRSNEQQAQLRAEYCGGVANIEVAGAKCRNPVALPGKSNHQGGRAIDFKESNTRDTDAYKWLSLNASKYGYYNKIASEPWHWSTTGR